MSMPEKQTVSFSLFVYPFLSLLDSYKNYLFAEGNKFNLDIVRNFPPARKYCFISPSYYVCFHLGLFNSQNFVFHKVKIWRSKTEELTFNRTCFGLIMCFILITQRLGWISLYLAGHF